MNSRTMHNNSKRHTVPTLLSAILLSAVIIPAQAEPGRGGSRGGHGGGNIPGLGDAHRTTPKANPGGYRPYAAYPAAVNVDLPDPQVVGRERRSTINCQSTQMREMQNAKNINSQKARADRQDALTKMNSYHGITSSSSQSSTNFASGKMPEERQAGSAAGSRLGTRNKR